MPVPVRRSCFTALREADASCNIEVDLPRMRTFEFTGRRVPAGDLLYCDFQTSLLASVAGRLGSGRSGYFRGKYLKGVGRTPLAGNWNDPQDWYHNSGHLLASAGIREYVASCYLEARGASDLINPCSGILLRRVERSLDRRLVSAFHGGRRAHVAPADRRFQALTVKRADFARFSNFVWLLDRITPASPFNRDFTIARFFHLLAGHLAGPCAKLPPAYEVDPSSVVDALAGAIARTTGNLGRLYQLGVHWGSYHNNLTADGRFLDLEVPLILGAPFFGYCIDRETRSFRQHQLARMGPFTGGLVGEEALQFLGQAGRFIRYLGRKTAWLSKEAALRPIERDFTGAVHAALGKAFPRTHPVFDARAAIRVAADIVCAGRGNAKAVRALVNATLRNSARGVGSRASDAPAFDRLQIEIASPEPGFRPIAYAPRLLRPPPGAFEHGIFVSECLRQLDRSTDLDDLLTQLRETRGKILGYCKQRSEGAELSHAFTV